MAALDGKITIGIDYRPCIVTIPEIIEHTTRRVKNSGWVTQRKFVKPEEKVKALFHCWSHRSKVVGESYLCGGHAAGQVSGTFAIVEFEDGTVKEIEPWNIQFVEGLINDYSFGTED